MDKLKEQLGPALKHAFWIGLGVALLGSLACWWLATSTIASQTETWASTINAKYGDMNQLQGKASTHPNSFSHKQMEANIDRLKTSVFEAWKSQYDRQTAIFVWPTQLLEETRAAFKPLHPIETTVAFPTPPDKEVPTHLRNDYGRYIEPRMNELAAIIGAKWKAAFKDPVGGGFGAGMGMESGGGSMMSIGPGEGYGMPANPAVPAEPPPLVDWTVGSQQELISQIFPWRKQTPTTLDVLYSQESLWILEAVLNVIKDVNDQGSKFQPPVKRIDRLSLGRGAGTLSGSVITTLNPTPMTGGMGGDGGYMSSSDSSMGGSGYGSSSSESSDLGMGGTSSAPSGVPAGPTVDPADKRYVDNKYDPIDAARLRGALTAADGNPTNADLVVAKRFPVKLKLFMDQRRIIPFLTACGNANLMLEIRQVRVAAEGTGAATGSGSGSEGGSEMGSMSGMSGMSGMSSESGYGSGSSGYGGGYGAPAAPAADNSNYIPVDITGVVYVFNPPDLKKLFIDKVEQNVTLSGDQPAPAGETPAAAAGAAPAAGTPAAAEAAPATPPQATTPADAGAASAAPNPDPAAAAPTANPGPGPTPAAPTNNPATPAIGPEAAVGPGSPAASPPAAVGPAAGGPAAGGPAAGGPAAGGPAAGGAVQQQAVQQQAVQQQAVQQQAVQQQAVQQQAVQQQAVQQQAVQQQAVQQQAVQRQHLKCSGHDFYCASSSQVVRIGDCDSESCLEKRAKARGCYEGQS